MACKDKEKFVTSEASTKAAMRTKGAIDRFLNIVDLGLFRTLNTKWSNDAKERFGIQNMLFSEENDGKKAVPNKEGFKAIDNAKGIFYQEGEELTSSKASNQTLAMVKDFLNRIGVSIENVDQIIVNGIKQNANGAALVTQQLVKVVNGKQDVALTEEAMHFAVEILQQTNAPLFKKLLSEINSYQILKDVYNTYGSNPAYQIDGKPDIIKLKKEAIAKVLTETVIKRNEGSTEKPELIAKAETWWDQIINALKSIFFTSGFDQAAMKVLSGEAIGTVEDVRAQEGEVFLQQTGDPQKRIVDELRDIDSKLVKKPTTVDGKQEDRYFFDGSTEYVKYRVTDFIKDWFAQKFADKDLLKSEYQEALDDLKKETGTSFHFDQEFLIKGYGDGNGGIFVDANGKLRDEADILDDSAYVSQIDPNNR
jgi:hypothetical protein